MKKIKDHSLYLVITEEYCRGRQAIEVAKSAIAGGVDMIQMREKNRSRDETLSLGKELAGLCKEKGVAFIVNDDPMLAKDIGARGVHLGQEDVKRWPIAKTRSIIGRDGIIGVSTHSLEQFKKANAEDVDYIAFGPIFPTKTKDYSIGTEDIKKVLVEAQKPVFFIGGINLSNINELIEMGAKNIAMIRGITEAKDIQKTTEHLKDRIRG